jgi:hypothetical protein
VCSVQCALCYPVTKAARRSEVQCSAVLYVVLHPLLCSLLVVDCGQPASTASPKSLILKHQLQTLQRSAFSVRRSWLGIHSPCIMARHLVLTAYSLTYPEVLPLQTSKLSPRTTFSLPEASLFYLRIFERATLSLLSSAPASGSVADIDCQSSRTSNLMTNYFLATLALPLQSLESGSRTCNVYRQIFMII